MGIKGLLASLKSITIRRHLSFYRNKRAAIDGYTWLHRAKYAIGEQILNSPTDISGAISYFLKRLFSLTKYGIRPVFVFDGASLPMKKNEEKKRREVRKELKKEAEKSLAKGDKSNAILKLLEGFDITPEFAYEFFQILKDLNVEYIVAPYEADAQLAYLAKTGYVDFVITEDSDLLAYGCSCVLFKLNQSENDVGEEVRFENLSKCSEFNFRGWDNDIFLSFCVLCGCDYFKLGGVGAKKAFKIMGESGGYRETLKSLILSAKSPGTLINLNALSEEFEKAYLTFKFQVVFDPISKKMRRFCENNECKVNFLAKYNGDMSFAGNIQEEEDVVENLIYGVIDPNTLEPLGTKGTFYHTRKSAGICFPSIDTSKRRSLERSRSENKDEKFFRENKFIESLLKAESKPENDDGNDKSESSNDFLEIEFKNPENQFLNKKGKARVNSEESNNLKSLNKLKNINNLNNDRNNKEENNNDIDNINNNNINNKKRKSEVIQNKKTNPFAFSHLIKNVESSDEEILAKNSKKNIEIYNNYNNYNYYYNFNNNKNKRKSAIVFNTKNNNKFNKKNKKKKDEKESKIMKNQMSIDSFFGIGNENKVKCKDKNNNNDNNDNNDNNNSREIEDPVDKSLDNDLMNYNFYSEKEAKFNSIYNNDCMNDDNSKCAILNNMNDEIKEVCDDKKEDNNEDTKDDIPLLNFDDYNANYNSKSIKNFSGSKGEININNVNEIDNINNINNKVCSKDSLKLTEKLNNYLFKKKKFSDKENIQKELDNKDKEYYLKSKKKDCTDNDKSLESTPCESKFLEDLLDKYKIDNVEKEIVDKKDNVEKVKKKNYREIIGKNMEERENKLTPININNINEKEDNINEKEEQIVVLSDDEEKDENSSKMSIFLDDFKFTKNKNLC